MTIRTPENVFNKHHARKFCVSEQTHSSTYKMLKKA
jgi:hypothetical protein